MSLCGSKTDTSGMNAAALANSQVAKDALDWYREAYTDQAPLRQQAADKALAVSDAQPPFQAGATKTARVMVALMLARWRKTSGRPWVRRPPPVANRLT